MDHKLTFKEYILVASMLFGMFFGAGNLIFPVFMGQNAGAASWPAIIGFCLTGVGLPLLGVVAMGMSRSENLLEMSGLVGRGYGYFFTTLLYLCIGPLFAIPRTATVSFSVGVMPMIDPEKSSLILLIFTAIFFAIVLFFSLRPSGILTWVGKLLNPIFLVFLAILAVTALINPMASMYDSAPMGNYETMSFFQGFLDGYNTMDALASLAFGIILITTIRDLGVKDSKAISLDTVKSGLLSMLLMAAIYCMLTIIGAQSRAVLGISADGGEALFYIGSHYFGKFGGVLLGITVTVACLKTAIGLITACSETFSSMFSKGKGYKIYAIVFTVFSFAISNVGLSKIIEFSLPVLMFLYPLTITLMLLGTTGRLFRFDRKVFVAVTVPTAVAAIFDFIKTLPDGIKELIHADAILGPVEEYLPFFKLGLGWVIPAVIGLIVGLVLHFAMPKKKEA